MTNKAQCYSRYIFVGRPARDGMPAERIKFYEWLALETLGVKRFDLHASEFYVSADEMKTHPAVVERLLHEIPDSEQKSLVILDLSLNSFHLVRDVFLRYVAGIVRRWLDSRPRQSVVILMPGRELPGRASMLWDLLPRDARDGLYKGRLTIIANDGTMWPDDATRPYTSAQYLARRSRNRDWLMDQLESRIIRKLGHYDFSGHRAKHCARYFYEAEQAVQEVGELVVDWVKNTLQPALPAGEPITLLSHGKQSDWFHDAVAGAASVLDMPLVAMKDDEIPLKIGENLSGWIAPIFKVVHTGETFRHIVDSLSGSGCQVTPHALAVIVSDDDVQTEANGTVLGWLSGPHNRDRRLSTDCPQCQLKLPHTSARAESILGIRAFDMWSMFLEFPWRPEKFGADRQQLYKSMPDMESIFRDHGNWIAYKIHYLLKFLGAGDEAAFVCPDERNVEVLVQHLGILLQDRQVTVRVPPKVVRSKNWQNELSRRREEEWHRQLAHLQSQRFRKIILIDETAGSKTTANGLVRLLREFELVPLAYVPIVDFAPDITIPGVRTFPLYQIRKRRGNTG